MPTDDKDDGFVEEDEVEMVDPEEKGGEEDGEGVSMEVINDSQVRFMSKLTSRRPRRR